VNQPSSNSEQQPTSPQPRIDQHSSGNFTGVQQGAIGNNISQVVDNSTKNYHNIYLALQDEDLEPLSLSGKILCYFKVLVFLVITLVFWVFFGIFTNFPFPYRQAIELMLCCFKGTVASKVNTLQKRLQKEDINDQSIEQLNNLDFQCNLYLGILKYLGTSKAESHERLAQTIQALKQNKIVLQNKIKPNQPQKYKIVTKVKDSFESITLSRAERDLRKIESILDEVTRAIRNNDPSETILQDTIDRLSKETTWRAGKISPSRIGILYGIKALLMEASKKEISNLEEHELNALINDLKKQKNTLSMELKEVQNDYELAQQKFRNYVDEHNSLSSLLYEYESNLSSLTEQLKNYVDISQSKQNQINTLNSQLNKANYDIKELHAQKNVLSQKINCLNQDINQKQAEINQLTRQLIQYSNMRIAEGKYIGNIKEKNSRYHFNPKCPDWKMLVAEYVLRLDDSPNRNIVSSNNSRIFIKHHLKKCKNCSQLN